MYPGNVGILDCHLNSRFDNALYSEDCTENTQKARILADQITDMLHEKLGTKGKDDGGLLDEDVYRALKGKNVVNLRLTPKNPESPTVSRSFLTLSLCISVYVVHALLRNVFNNGTRGARADRVVLHPDIYCEHDVSWLQLLGWHDLYNYEHYDLY